ncbi:MAG: hypothetical protein WDN26_02560 [Chitinophagaceae bacterium]
MIKQFMFLKKWMIAPLFLFILFSCKKDKVENSPVIEKNSLLLVSIKLIPAIHLILLLAKALYSR